MANESLPAETPEPEHIQELIESFMAGEDIPRTDPFASEEERKRWADAQNLRSYIQVLREEREMLRGSDLDAQRMHVQDELRTAEQALAALLFPNPPTP